MAGNRKTVSVKMTVERHRQTLPTLDSPHPVDVHVGVQLRARRTLIGWSQQQLGDAVGLTFQQVQKYERGANRISASRLYRLARLLGVQVSYFFEGLPPDGPVCMAATGMPEDRQDAEEVGSILKKRETLELVRAYYGAPRDARRRILDLAVTLADLPSPRSA